MFHGRRLVQGLLLSLLLRHEIAAAAAAATETEENRWVSVDESGVPKTVTPVMSTVSGTPTAVSDAAPFEVTATVRTKIDHGYVSTSTGRSLPTAAAGSKNGAGAFPICHNSAGPDAPFCFPSPGSQLHPGTTYYVTWDPSFFPSSNTTVVVYGSYRNSTTGSLSDEEAFASSPLSVTRAFYAWPVEREVMQQAAGANISIGLRILPVGNSSTTPVRGPDVYVTKTRAFSRPRPGTASGPALYIGLPLVLGFITMMLIGTLVWNRKARSINIGNIMSRARRGGYQKLGSGRSRRNQERPKENIGLMEFDAEAEYANQGRFSIDSRYSSDSGSSPARHRRSS